MKRLGMTAIALLALSLFSAGNLRAAEGPNSKTKAITAVLNEQAAAWNRGDLEKFLTSYVDSPDTSYTSGGVEVWGYNAIRDRYKNKYGNQPETMGSLSFNDLRVSDTGNKSALCIGHWHLERRGQATLEGTFSLVFIRSNGTWKILHDHTSVKENKTNS